MQKPGKNGSNLWINLFFSKFLDNETKMFLEFFHNVGFFSTLVFFHFYLEVTPSLLSN